MSYVCDQDFHLSLADQNNVRTHVQKLHIFPFPDGAQAEDAIHALSAGLRVTLMKFPFLAGRLGPEDPETGKLSLRFPGEISDEVMAVIFHSKILYDYPFTYEALKTRGFPMLACKGEWFCPDILRKTSGIPPLAEGLTDFKGNSIPALSVQATFIPGGLVLSVYGHHSIMDGMGTAMFMRYFADGVNPRKNELLLSREALPDQSAMREKVDARAQPSHTTKFGAYTTEKYDYPKTLDDQAPCSVKLFVIPASRLHGYRDELQKAGVQTMTPITIFNVLSALIWTHITRARAEDLEKIRQSSTRAGIAVNWRKRQEPALDDHYMGNMAHFAVASRDISELVTEKHVTNETIIPVVQEINRGISEIKPEWTQQLLNYLASIEPIVDTECALGFHRGPDIYITSWLHMGADFEWGIPGTSSSKPGFIRRAHCGNGSDGGIIIMPRSREVVDGQEAPYEVMVRLATCHMEKLINEEAGLATRWAEKVLD
ncbi:trichothecene 3-O-acetyltransferas-like protein [Lophiostoma macrostomum CBS 122681]|uniref:Trichothecene 3-O-acetyltransferas-like protein n=1 Tax=Lophiostoma macrostomum CBS 122681 TaxID=1314788 RepID=A0A6A6STU3_9PLEO|nr:trichothecene 3-O-acetyltransferas-like protein [Lophiostoma macrostomum CBS 122681]